MVWVKKAPDSHLSYKKDQQPMKDLKMIMILFPAPWHLAVPPPVYFGHESAQLRVQGTHSDKLRLRHLRHGVRFTFADQESHRLVKIMSSIKVTNIVLTLSQVPGLCSVSPTPSNIFQTCLIESPNSSTAIDFELSTSKILKDH